MMADLYSKNVKIDRNLFYKNTFMQYEQKQFQQENEEKTQNTKNQNISADLLKEFFKKKIQNYTEMHAW